MRADKGPLLSKYASFAKRFAPQATFTATMKKLGYQPDASDEKKHPHGEFYDLELRRLEAVLLRRVLEVDANALELDGHLFEHRSEDREFTRVWFVAHG